MTSCGDMWFETIKETQDTQYVDARSRTMALVGTQDERRPGLVGGRRSLPSMFTTGSATWMRIATGYDYVNDLYLVPGVFRDDHDDFFRIREQRMEELAETGNPRVILETVRKDLIADSESDDSMHAV